jgi:hypothetical protein
MRTLLSVMFLLVIMTLFVSVAETCFVTQEIVNTVIRK